MSSKIIRLFNRFLYILSGAALIAGMALSTSFSAVFASLAATTTVGVVPTLVSNWQSGDSTSECSVASTYTGVNYIGGYKVDNGSNGTYNSGTITISNNSDTKHFDWSSTYNIGAVIVKAGTNAYIYKYSPTANADTGLYSPNNSGGQQAAISHVEFCWTSIPTATTPAPTQTTPAPTETTPAPTETTPAPTETTPAPTETTPAPTETTPAPTQTTPAPTETTPAPTVTTPAPTETTPAPTETTPAPTETTPAPTETTPAPSETPFIPVTGLSPLVFIDPYCTVSGGALQWTVENPNDVNVNVLYWTLDGGAHNAGFTAVPGSTALTTTTPGTHTITVVYGDSQSVSDTSTIQVCPLPVPNTGNGLLIPVTGANDTQKLGQGLLFGGLSIAGLGVILSVLRKFLNL